MPLRQTVVRNRSKIEKPRLHALLMEGWARCIARFGKGAWSDALGISSVGLDKQLTGTMPGFETIMDAFDHDDSVLDDVFREKGFRLVSTDAVCDVDDLGLLLSRVLVMLNEAEHPDGPGGRSIVPQEYITGEPLMRDLHAASGRWLEKCSSIRRPRSVA